MKKILLSLLALSLIFGAVYAQDGGITPSITLNSSLTWGIDLNSGASAVPTHGFLNKSSFDFRIPLYSGSLSKGGDGDVNIEFTLGTGSTYSTIRSSDRTANNNGKYQWGTTTPNIRQLGARLNFFGAYFEVYNRPAFSTNYANRDWSIVMDPVNGNGTVRDADYGDVGLGGTGDIVAYGLTLGYEAENLGGSEAGLSAALKLGSNDDWTKTHGVLGKNQYAMGLDLGFNFGDYVNLGAGFNVMFANFENQDFKNSDAWSDYATGHSGGNKLDKPYIGFGFEVGSKAVEGLDVKFAMDAFPNAVGGAALDFLFDATYKWVNFALFAGNKYSYPSTNKEGKVGGNMDVRLGFVSDGSDEDTRLVEGLDLEVALHLNDLLDHHPEGVQFPMGLYVGGGYKANLTDSMWIKPYFGLWGETNAYAKDGKGQFGLAYKLGVTYSPLENVEIDAAWKHGSGEMGFKNATRGVEGNGVLHYLNEKNHNGFFSLGLKLIY